MNKTIHGHIAAFLTILIWGTTFISTKVLLRNFEPVEILFIRFMIGYMALWCVCPRRLNIRERKQEWYFAAAGLCGVTLYYLCKRTQQIRFAETCHGKQVIQRNILGKMFLHIMTECLDLLIWL